MKIKQKRAVEPVDQLGDDLAAGKVAPYEFWTKSTDGDDIIVVPPTEEELLICRIAQLARRKNP